MRPMRITYFLALSTVLPLFPLKSDGKLVDHPRIFWQYAPAAMFPRCPDFVFRLAIVSGKVAVLPGRDICCPVSAY